MIRRHCLGLRKSAAKSRLLNGRSRVAQRRSLDSLLHLDLPRRRVISVVHQRRLVVSYQVGGVVDRGVDLGPDLVYLVLSVEVSSNNIVGLNELVELSLQVLVLLRE